MKKITFILITIFSLVCLFSCEKKTGWGGKKPDIPEKPINGISVDFRVNMIPGFAPRKVTFINMTRGQASRCVFDFGDGSTAEVELDFYDYDPVGQDEWMGGYYFYIKNWMNKSGSELPGKINFKNSDSELKFELNVNWIL